MMHAYDAREKKERDRKISRQGRDRGALSFPLSHSPHPSFDMRFE